MITLIELKQTGPDRFLARFDNGEEIRTTTNVVADLSLRTHMVLSDDEYSAVCNRSSLSLCKQRALRIIGARAISVKELKDKLKAKGESEEDVEEAAEWLLEMHLLDDQQYAEMCVRHYASKGYGLSRIRSELYRRGIAKDLWDSALMQLPEQDSLLQRLLAKKLKSADPSREEIRKAADYLYRRGFQRDEIADAMNRFLNELENENHGL